MRLKPARTCVRSHIGGDERNARAMLFAFRRQRRSLKADVVCGADELRIN